MGTMIQVSARSWSPYLFGLAAVSLIACASGETSKPGLTTSPDDKSGQSTSGDDDDTSLNGNPNTGTGAFGSSTSSSGSTTSSSGASTSSSSSSSSSGTVTTTNYCTGTLAAGDIVITEMMISSKSGSGDAGEWVEITSTRDCVLKLAGVTIESPRGTTSTDSAAVSATYELQPHGTFIAADNTGVAGLTGDVFAWNASDVLKNDTDTVSVMLGGTTIDSITYSSPGEVTGSSLEFPANCAATLRSDVSQWVSSTTTFGGSFKGTPNAPNNDVACLQ